MIFFSLNLVIVLILTIPYKVKSDLNDSCPFVYTVDLSDSILLQNGSYLYQNNTIIPPKYVQDYNYAVLYNNGNFKKVETYKRGCICAVKQCLPICSHDMESFYGLYESISIDDGFIKNVTFSDGIIRQKHLLKDFYPIYGQVCDVENAYMMLPEFQSYSDWTLYENSILYRHHDKKNLTITEYCFDVYIVDDEYTFVVNPIVCGETIEIPWFKIWSMTFSIPFFIITIIRYYIVTKPKIVANKCFLIYLSFVTFSYALISCYTISGVHLEHVNCQIFGFVLYYTIAGYLTWTCILSYSIWKSITDTFCYEPSFGNFCLIGFLVPMLLTFLTFLAQISNLPEDWKPGIAMDICAVNTLRWSAVIYYYIPCSFVFVYSLSLYICIGLFKKKHDAELIALFNQIPESVLERCCFFFHIFLFMGISWGLDILSYFFRIAFGAEEYFVYSALDLFNACHGFLVYLGFSWRHKFDCLHNSSGWDDQFYN